MNDWSEEIATLPSRVANLVNALNDGKWETATRLAAWIGADMFKIIAWIALKGK